jgi:hypothetical protein
MYIYVGTFNGNLPQVVNIRRQVTVVQQDFNNTLPPLPRYDNKTAHIVTKSILACYNVVNITLPVTGTFPYREGEG